MANETKTPQEHLKAIIDAHIRHGLMVNAIEQRNYEAMITELSKASGADSNEMIGYFRERIREL